MIDARRARRELERLLADQSAAVRAFASRVADEVATSVTAGQDPTGVVARAVGEIEPALASRIARDVVQAVCLGAGIWPQLQATGFVDQFASEALVLRWDASGMTLSQRVHGTIQAFRGELDTAIRMAISRRDTAWRTSRRIYDGYGFGGILHREKLPELPADLRTLIAQANRAMGDQDAAALDPLVARVASYAQSLRTAPLKAAYLQLTRVLERGLERGLEQAIRTATEEKARYHAERIARTEAARAWGEGFTDQLARDPDVVGVRWETSSAHRIFDICDFHSRADLYAMGPGVYPLDRRPRFPAHPHCLCVQTPVYTAPARRDRVGDGGRAALAGMTAAQRARLLTISGAKTFDANGSWRGNLRQWSDPDRPEPSQGGQRTLEAARAFRYTDQGSTRAAEAWARAHDLADTVDYSGLHVEVANRINETVFRHLLQFPALRAGLQFLGNGQALQRKARQLLANKGWPKALIQRAIQPIRGDTLAFSVDKKHIQYDGTWGIGLNSRIWGANYPAMKPILEAESGVGKFHPPGKDPATDTVAHELGHQIDALLGLRHDPSVQALWKAAVEKGVNEEVSEYASIKGIAEGIAEGWCEAFAGNSPRAFASGLRERILQIVESRK